MVKSSSWLHRALRLAWITWIPFIQWFSMIFKIGLNIVHGFMNATFIDESLYQWSLTINVHSCIYEHTSCMINDHRNSYEHWSSMIIDIDYDSWRSMIVAMKCCWSYMISVDHCIISWTLSWRQLERLVCAIWANWVEGQAAPLGESCKQILFSIPLHLSDLKQSAKNFVTNFEAVFTF